MKKLLLVLFSTVFLFGCSTPDNEPSSESSTTKPSTSNPSISDPLAQYESEVCVDFVKFHESNKTFLNYLISKGYDLNNDSKISCSEASLIIDLNLEDNGYVTNFKGIEYLKNLKRLSGFIKIPDTYLSVSLLNLYNNIYLEELNLDKVNISVQNGVNYATRGWINTLVLPKSNSLKVLNCPSTTITKVLNISIQSNLELLNLIDSNLTGEIDLSNSNKLSMIDLTSNGLSTIKFSNIQNPYLQTLKIGTSSLNYNNGYSRNKLTAITLTTFPNLIYLDVSYNNITSINISQNPNLIQSYLTNNKLLNLSLSANNLIEYLNADNNLISILNTSNLLNLKIISLKNNLLDNIDLSNNTNLFKIVFDNNDLKTLNIQNGNNKQINYFSVKQNTIDCIKIDNGFTPNASYWLKDNTTKYCY